MIVHLARPSRSNRAARHQCCALQVGEDALREPLCEQVLVVGTDEQPVLDAVGWVAHGHEHCRDGREVEPCQVGPLGCPPVDRARLLHHRRLHGGGRTTAARRYRRGPIDGRRVERVRAAQVPVGVAVGMQAARRGRHPAALASCARSALDRFTSLVVRVMTTLTPAASRRRLRLLAICRTVSYSGAPVSTPVVPPVILGLARRRAGPHRLGLHVRVALMARVDTHGVGGLLRLRLGRRLLRRERLRQRERDGRPGARESARCGILRGDCGFRRASNRLSTDDGGEPGGLEHQIGFIELESDQRRHLHGSGARLAVAVASRVETDCASALCGAAVAPAKATACPVHAQQEQQDAGAANSRDDQPVHVRHDEARRGPLRVSSTVSRHTAPLGQAPRASWSIPDCPSHGEVLVGPVGFEPTTKGL